MRILMCSRWPLTRQLGASKVLIEVADALKQLGSHVDLAGPDEIGADPGAGWRHYAEALRAYLTRESPSYDVVDYDHECLPFSRSEFHAATLMVARSVLLVHHLETIPLPQPRGLKPWAGRLLHGRARRAAQRHRITDATATLRAADLVNVSNDHDKAELERRGFNPQKIVVIPFGLSPIRQAQFDQLTRATPPPRPIIAFVGTFDFRKGASDFPQIARHVAAAIPDVRFRLLGTKGLFATQQQVLGFFPSALQNQIEVLAEFPVDDLPRLLSDCSIGVFPSYIEGFGFGVLEMLAAHLPVIAYDAPGPPMMLPPEYLVPRGNAAAMARKLVDLLANPPRLAAARAWANERSRAFSWARIGHQTAQAYSGALRLRRAEKT